MTAPASPSATDIRHCFTYGSLMCADIMHAACGAPVGGEPAVLHGFSRHPVAGVAYPGIRPQPGAQVSGILYRALSPDALARLDLFEGEQYRRETVSVVLPDGTCCAADTYVFKSEFAHLLLPGDWDFAAFLAAGKRQFEADYLGFARVAP